MEATKKTDKTYEAMKNEIRNQLTKNQIEIELFDNYCIHIKDSEGSYWTKEEGVVALAKEWLDDTEMKYCDSIYENLIAEVLIHN